VWSFDSDRFDGGVSDRMARALAEVIMSDEVDEVDDERASPAVAPPPDGENDDAGDDVFRFMIALNS